MDFEQNPLNFIETKTELSETIMADHGVWIRSGSVITNTLVDENVFIGFNAQIQHAQIERSVQIATGVKILGTKEKPVRVRQFSWIGARAVIHSGVRIGEGSIVGAGSHVLHDVPDDTIVVGHPARFLKRRRPIQDHPPLFQDFLLKVKANYATNPPSDSNNSLNLTGQKFKEEQIGEGSILQGKVSTSFPNAGIVLGKESFIGNNCVLESSGGITIGEHTLIGNGVTIVSISHDYTKLSLPTIVKRVDIGNNVKVGEDSLIILGAKIRDGTSIPAHCLVLKDKIIESVG